MKRRSYQPVLFWAWGLAGLAFFILFCLSAVLARPTQAASRSAPTPGGLISAVNQLRVEHGLNALSVHPILMQTAQMQADALMASGGAVGHTRPNGLSFTNPKGKPHRAPNCYLDPHTRHTHLHPCIE